MTSSKDKERVALTAAHLRLFLPILVLGSLLLFLLVFLLYQVQRERAQYEIKIQEQTIVDLQKNIVDHIFSFVIGDLRFLTTQNELHLLHKNMGKTAYESNRLALQNEYAHLADAKIVYDQIRYINWDGRERVRINLVGGRSQAVPSEQLQDKSKRYYFTETRKLPPGDVFLSPLDLNVEKQTVEKPFKPMIRFASPVYDAEGRPFGIVVLNYLAQNLLDRILEAGGTTSSEIMMLNEDGYWLLSPHPEQNWGFMFPDRMELTFGATYPEEWRTIQEQQNGQLETRNGLFTFATLYPPQQVMNSLRKLSKNQSNDLSRPQDHYCEKQYKYQWILVVRMPPKNIRQALKTLSLNSLTLGVGLLLLFIASAYVLSLFITRRSIDKAQLIAMAQYDSLTKLPNRALFFDRLDVAIKQTNRSGNKLALLYIDLDGFKPINDSMGHKAGDEILMHVASLLQDSVRKSDTVARLGGDEFAAILPAIHSGDEARKVGEKMLSKLDQPIQISMGVARVGASIGVAIYPDHAADAESLIHVADQSMYEAKRENHSVCVLQEC